MFRNLLYILLTFFIASESFAEARIKDIVHIEGIRDNILIGYGLVVGLNGSGDNLNNSAFTQKGLVDFLERLGVNTRGANLKTKNIAAVTVTAVLPPFARLGSRIDVQVSTLGDAKSLEDGTLLATPLLGADGQVYAVAQGQIYLGGIEASGQGAGTKISKQVTTNATVMNGAIIEKEIPFRLESLNTIKLALKNPDITTAMQISDAINIYNRNDIAKAIDPGTVEVFIPMERKKDMVRFLSEIEQLVVYPDQAAKIVVDEASGTIVMGKDVRVSPIAIAQGNLNVIIQDQKGREDPTIPVEEKIVDDKKKKDPEVKGNQMVVMPSGTSLGELVDALNSLGVGPRDLITILQTIKSAGALQASIELR